MGLGQPGCLSSLWASSVQCLGTLRPPPQEFIEEILSPPFGGMIAFVKESEALIEKGQLDRLRGEEGMEKGPCSSPSPQPNSHPLPLAYDEPRTPHTPLTQLHQQVWDLLGSPEP